MSKRENVVATQRLVNDKDYKKLVNDSISEMDTMQQALTNAGINGADARLMVQQAYLRNLKMAGTPGAMMQKTLGELATRIELDRMINPEADLVSEKYQDLVELQMKAIKTLSSLEKNITVTVQNKDDGFMGGMPFIDVEDD